MPALSITARDLTADDFGTLTRAVHQTLLRDLDDLSLAEGIAFENGWGLWRSRLHMHLRLESAVIRPLRHVSEQSDPTRLMLGVIARDVRGHNTRLTREAHRIDRLAAGGRREEARTQIAPLLQICTAVFTWKDVRLLPGLSDDDVKAWSENLRHEATRDPFRCAQYLAAPLQVDPENSVTRPIAAGTIGSPPVGRRLAHLTGQLDVADLPQSLARAYTRVHVAYEAGRPGKR